MKIIDLRKKTLKNLSISIVILSLLGVGYFLNSRSKNSLDEKIKKSKSEISSVKSKSTNLENFEKLKKIWGFYIRISMIPFITRYKGNH